MPLQKSSSQKAFVNNLKTEMEHGKPQKQSLAIAYQMKRKAKKKASGGTVNSGDPEMNYACGGYAEGGDTEETKPEPSPSPEPELISQEEAEKFAKGANFAEGGDAFSGKQRSSFEKGVHHMWDKGKSVAGMLQGSNDEGSKRYAKEKHHDVLAEAKAMPGPTEGKAGFAEGGHVCSHCGGYTEYSEGYQTADHEMDTVDRAMHKRKMSLGGLLGKDKEEEQEEKAHERHKKEEQRREDDEWRDKEGPILGHLMSEGGKVANETDPISEFMPNEFDDLVLRDDLEASDTGANSGDEISYDESYKDDPVSRAMLKRRAKKT